jgi:GTP-binding protein HflX
LIDIEASQVPERLVFNKVDAADPDTLTRLRSLSPDATLVSAATGEGVEALRVAIEEMLPRPQVEVDVLVPYNRGDLVARMHSDAEVISTEHTPEGTHLKARVRPGLAAALAGFATSS